MKTEMLTNYECALKSIPPPGGNGCHPHLMRVANYGAMEGIDLETMVADIKRRMPKGTRTVPDGEIRVTVERAVSEIKQNTARPASALAKNAVSIGAAQDNDLVNAANWLRSDPPSIDPLIKGAFDVGDKGAIIGPSKMRKSFVSLQLALCAATGRRFLKWPILERRKVLVVQLEVQPRWYWRRVRQMASALDVSADSIDNWLYVRNGRGQSVSLDDCQRWTKECEAQFLIIDPIYKLMLGAENTAEAWTQLLAQIDQVMSATGAAVLYVHHDAKGVAGDRETRDRGSGSGVIGRDYDFCMTLTEHREQPDSVVIQTLTRNYAPSGPFCCTWESGHYELDEALPVTVATSQSKVAQKSRGPSLHELAQQAAKIVQDTPMSLTQFKAEIQDQLSVGKGKADDVSKLVRERDDVVTAKVRVMHGETLIGPPGVTELEAQRRANRKNKDQTSQASHTSQKSAWEL